MSRSELEETFEVNFREKFEKDGWTMKTEVTIPGERYRYDFLISRYGISILLEIDGHGFGHSSVVAKARDAQKANHAVLNGYLMLRLTTKHFRRYKGVLLPADYTFDLVDKLIKLRKKKNLTPFQF